MMSGHPLVFRLILSHFMDEVYSMKKKTIAITLTLLMLAFILMIWFVRPLIGMKLFYWSYDEGDTFTLDDYKQMYYDCSDEYQLIRDDLSFRDSETGCGPVDLKNGLGAKQRISAERHDR